MDGSVAKNVLFIALAGSLGSLARYGVAGWVSRATPPDFPWGTFAVNIAGCFLAGLLWSVFENRLSLAPYRMIVFVGFLGAFTTFSSFALETGQLARDAEWFRAAGNILLNNTFGIVFYFSGLFLGRLI